MAPEYDVFISYNSEDREPVRQITGKLGQLGVKCWFDVEQPPDQAGFRKWLEGALERSGAVAVFCGPSGVGKYQEAEVDVAIDQQLRDQRRVVPVLLPGAPDPQELSPFLRRNTVVEFRAGPDDQGALERLYESIMGRPVRAESPVPSATPRSSGSNEVGITVEDLAKALRSGSRSVTYFLGDRSSQSDPDTPSLAWDLAQQLLQELDLIDAGYDKLLPPLHTAGIYYSIREGPDGLENKVGQYVREHSGSVPTLFRRLARLLAIVAERRATQRHADALLSAQASDPQLIVTTTLDAMLERELLSKALPFTRIVQSRDGSRVTTHYKEVTKLAKESIRVRYGSGRESKPLNLGRTSELDEAVTAAAERVTAKGNDPLSLAECAPLIVYKYLGSADVKGSCTISTDHMFSTLQGGVRVPETLTSIIGQSHSLFLGCGLLDTGIRHLYYNVLRKAFATGDTGDFWRFALLLPPTSKSPDGYSRMEVNLWDRLKRRARSEFNIGILEDQGDVFVDKLIQSLEGGGA